MNDQIQQLLADAPPWAREPAVQIGAGVVVALLLLWLLSRLFRGRPRDEEIFEPVYQEEVPVTRPITPPPVTSPPPIAEQPIAPLLPPVSEIAPERKPEPAPELAPAPVIVEPEAEVPSVPELEPEPEPTSLYIPDEAPEPAPFADEPIAAAGPLDASPASIAAAIPSPEPEPLAAPATPDDLTRLKGVGPRLADRLNSVGITSFAQLAALTPEDADALDAKLGDFQGRIHRDRWIEQAGYLSNGDIAGFEAVFGRL
ncbi:helix-hairpin-helix domain-containing protein [Sphingomonas sp.]|jgi:predicted flap endonuclease-1-like 5' DNA nuclease|uniref:helix-hairpin-helix domain-containing protein n=1 Tax=Sphingomonas sp. TaxID=28214 RepID=UPI002ED7FAA1